MYDNITFDEFLKKISNNKDKNVKLVKSSFKDLDLNIVLKCLIEKQISKKIYIKKILAIEALLELGASINFDDGTNVLTRYMIYNAYPDEKEMLKLIETCLNYKIDINSKYDGRTILHFLFNGLTYTDNICAIYKLLTKHNYDIFITRNYNKLDKFHSLYSKDTKQFLSLYNEDRKRLYKIKFNEKINKIKEKYPNLNNVQDTILHDIVSEQYDEEMTIDIIKYLLENGVNPNIKDESGNNFIMKAILAKHDYEYVSKLLELSLDYGLNVNHQNVYGDTLIHFLLKSKYTFELIPIFDKFIDMGFDYKKNNNNDEDIYYLATYKSIIRDLNNFIKKYNYLYKGDNHIKIKEFDNLGDFIYFNDFSKKSYLNNKFEFNRRCIMIVGDDKTLKTANLNHLANYYSNYRLRGKVFITSFDKMLNNCKTIGNLREYFIFVIEKCIKNDITLFIDDLDKIFNINNDPYYHKQLCILLNYYFTNKKERLYLVATVNKKNVELFDNDLLKKCISKIKIEDLNNNQLNDFIDDYINDIKEKNNIIIEDKLVILIKELITNIFKTCYLTKDISNTKIVIDIFNKMFEYKEDIDINNLIYSIKTNNFLIDKIENIVIEELNKLKNNYTEENIKKLIKELN